MNILLTGSVGFIGRNILETFADRWPEHTFVTLDTRPGADLKYNLQDPLIWEPVRKVDAIFHLAAQSGVRGTRESIVEYNLTIVKQLVSWATKNDVRFIVNASSSSVYGNMPVNDEAFGVSPMSHYAESKVKCETYLTQWARATESSVVHLRLFNNIGRYQRANMLPSLIASQMKRAQTGSVDTLKLFGVRSRGWTYVGDTARAFHAALSTFYGSRAGQSYIFNVGTGQSLSQHQLIDLFEQKSGLRVSYEDVAEIPTEVARTQAHVARFESVFGWHPDHQNVDLGISEVLSTYGLTVMR